MIKYVKIFKVSWSGRNIEVNSNQINKLQGRAFCTSRMILIYLKYSVYDNIVIDLLIYSKFVKLFH